MKPVFALLACALAGSASGGIKADFVTSAGTITAELHHESAPMTVANLMTLAEGTRAWVDTTTGTVRNDEFFTRLGFFHLPDGAGGKLIATGSRTGDALGDPGYTFPDEIDPTITHQPYVLAMASDGPNTNGSRICFTGAAAVPIRDGLHTVFGSVADPTSRAVIDTILAADSGTLVITTLHIRRTDPTDFDEHAVPLPVVTPLAPMLRISPGVAVEIIYSQPHESALRAHASNDLATWTPHYRSFTGIDDPLPDLAQKIDAAELPSRYYRFSAIDYPNPTGCASLANRTLTTETPQSGTLIYHFDATGLGGTYENIVLGTPFYEGSFEVRQEIPPTYGAYSFNVLLYLFDEELGGSPFNHIRGGLDETGPTHLVGRHVTTFLDSGMNFVFEDHGPLQLTRP